MNSYIDIGIFRNGKKYLARLYGDRIVCGECNLELNRYEISKYHLNIFRRKIQLTAGDVTVTTDYHKVIHRWLDHSYEIRYAFTLFSIILPAFFGVFFFGIKALVPAVLMAAANVFLIHHFFKKVRESHDSFYRGIVMLVLVICLPVVYWYPYSGYIFVIGMTMAVIIAAAGFFYRNAFNAKKYYLSLAWIMISIFYYFWLIAIFKFWTDFQGHSKIKESCTVSQDKTRLVFMGTIWEKPVDWQVEPYSLWNTLLQRKSPLWQFSPLPIIYEIKTAIYQEFGWITVLNTKPENILEIINTYINKANTVFLLDLLNVSEKTILSLNGQMGLLQTFTYYDMIQRREIQIHVFVIPVLQNEPGSPFMGSVVFALALPPGASLNYHLEIIGSGFISRSAK